MASRYPQHIARMTDRELVEAAILKWGGDLGVFAEEIIRVNRRTLYDWRHGVSRLNKRRRQQLIEYLNPPTTRENAS